MGNTKSESTASQMRSKPVILISVALLALVLASWAVYRIWDERLWPLSKGKGEEAFLGTTFGMSPQEVRTAIAKHWAQLLTYEDYRRREPSPSIETDGFIPTFSDDCRGDTSFYMSSIEMFDSKVEAEFRFRHEHLASVEIHFDPVAHSKAGSLAAAVESKLRSTYQFSRRDESQEVPGAYTLCFTSTSATPSLWVNLTERERPIIILTIVHPTTQADRKRKIENRERTAFKAEE